MPKTVTPLTKTRIEAAKPRAKIYELSDGDGLSLAITPTHSKIWRHKYTHPFSQRRKTITYGAYPAISLSDARQRRASDKALIAKGIDPLSHRQLTDKNKKLAQDHTLISVASQWMTIKKSEVTESYAADIWRSLELHVFPTLGPKPIHELRAPMVIEAIKPLEAKGTLETIKRVNQRINEIMIWSVNTGLIDANPLAGIRHAFLKPVKSKLPSLPPSELPALFLSISKANIKIVTRRMMYWLLHTMVRPSEGAGTQWSEIDTDNRVWKIPAHRMKKGKPHAVPLSDQALGIIESMRAISGHKQFVFPSDIHPSQSINPQTANATLKRLGYNGKLVAHGFRSIASTYLNESGHPPDLIEAALAHVDKNEVRAAYNRASYLEQRRDLMKAWSHYIDEAMAQTAKGPGYE